jgi:hypothetical protein
MTLQFGEIIVIILLMKQNLKLNVFLYNVEVKFNSITRKLQLKSPNESS